jgi:hypothetical protein
LITAGVGPGEQIILSAQCHRTHAIFGDIIVDLQPSIAREPSERLTPIDGIAERRGQRGFGGQFSAGGFSTAASRRCATLSSAGAKAALASMA